MARDLITSVVQLQSRAPGRIPKVQDPKFSELVGEKLEFTVTRQLIAQVKKQFFQTDEYEEDEDLRGTKEFTDNHLNAPIYDYLAFTGGTYFDLEDNEITYGGGVEKQLIILPALLTASRSKNIVKTKVQGRTSSVKEFMGSGDLMFTVTGKLVSATNKYPEQEVRILREILNAETEIDIESNFITLITENDYDVVIESYSLPQRRGYRNTQDFAITMSIDRPLELREEEARR